MNDGEIDLKSGDIARFLRVPDLRLVGVDWMTWMESRPFIREVRDARRAFFYHVCRGGAFFRAGLEEGQLHYVGAGMTVGVEGHAHMWMDRSQVHPSLISRSQPAGEEPDLPLEIRVSSIDRSAAVLQRLPDGVIFIPASADPWAKVIRGAVELIDLSRGEADPDDAVLRRLAEVIMLQLIGYARSRLLRGMLDTPAVLHDEFLLRALTAFLADPSRQWTVASLAEAGGLSRAAFADRFSRAFGEPVLRTINRLRLQQAHDMLRRSNASLADIAAEVGFGSAAAFVRAFRHLFGSTPGQWRNACRQKTVDSLDQPIETKDQ